MNFIYILILLELKIYFRELGAWPHSAQAMGLHVCPSWWVWVWPALVLGLSRPAPTLRRVGTGRASGQKLASEITANPYICRNGCDMWVIFLIK